jgi:hypothetical protein
MGFSPSRCGSKSSLHSVKESRWNLCGENDRSKPPIGDTFKSESNPISSGSSQPDFDTKSERGLTHSKSNAAEQQTNSSLACMKDDRHVVWDTLSEIYPYDSVSNYG